MAPAEPPLNHLPSSTSYGSPAQPSSLYGIPGFDQTAAIIKPSIKYGTPINQYGAPISQYGAPGGGYKGGHDDGSSEPANYHFRYHVQDAHYGTNFGHEEARQGDVAQGKYFVFLPDGRRQVVEYVADHAGYRPKISYEGTANAGGYGKGGGLCFRR